MAGFRRGQNRRHGFRVAHFTHQNDIGILPQNAAQRVNEIGRIAAHLYLFDDRLRVRVVIFNRIFNRDNVESAALVDQFDKRRQRGRLAASGGTGDQNQTLPALQQFPQCRRKMQRLERRNTRRKQANAGGHRASLEVQIGPAADTVRTDKTEIERFLLIQFGTLIRTQATETESYEHLRPSEVRGWRRPDSRHTRRMAGDSATKRRSDAFRSAARASNCSRAAGARSAGFSTAGVLRADRSECAPEVRVRGAVQFGDDPFQFVIETRHRVSRLRLF